METSTIGTQIKRYRKMRGMTQAALAEKCNLTDRHLIRKYESGIVTPKKSTLDKLCEVLGIEISFNEKKIFSESLDI